jgi:hypothetical protein
MNETKNQPALRYLDGGPEDMLDDPRIIAVLREYADKQLIKENENLQGLVRRLEKSNQQLGEENHRLGGEGTGWNKNVT